MNKRQSKEFLEARTRQRKANEMHLAECLISGRPGQAHHDWTFAHDLIWAEYPDGAVPGRVTHRLIKGTPLLEGIVSSGLGRPVTETTVPCGNEAAVDYLYVHFGDGRPEAA